MSEAQRIKLARAVAVAADLLELAVMPAFAQGALSPANDVLDVVVGVIMVWLLGWHWAFLPTFAAELVPLVTLVPTWTAAVFLVTRGHTPAQGDPRVTEPIDVPPERPQRSDPPRPRDEA
jgi:hypothetical protein